MVPEHSGVEAAAASLLATPQPTAVPTVDGARHAATSLVEVAAQQSVPAAIAAAEADAEAGTTRCVSNKQVRSI